MPVAKPRNVRIGLYSGHLRSLAGTCRCRPGQRRHGFAGTHSYAIGGLILRRGAVIKLTIAPYPSCKAWLQVLAAGLPEPTTLPRLAMTPDCAGPVLPGYPIPSREPWDAAGVTKASAGAGRAGTSVPTNPCTPGLLFYLNVILNRPRKRKGRCWPRGYLGSAFTPC